MTTVDRTWRWSCELKDKRGTNLFYSMIADKEINFFKKVLDCIKKENVQCLAGIKLKNLLRMFII